MTLVRRKPSVSLVPIIIFANVAVFLAWVGLASPTYMEDNFVVSWQSLLEGRYWTLLTSVFSHNLFFHLFINMYVLHSFGGLIERLLGPWRFLRFYLVAGVVASLSHCIVSAWFVGEPEMGAVGASGAIAGLVLLFSLIFPREKLLLFGLIPVPAIFGAMAFVGLDLWGLWAQAGGGGLPIGHGAHLGGAFTGVVYYFFILRPRLNRSGLPYSL